MSRLARSDCQARRQSRSLARIVSTLVLFACGQADPTAPTTSTVNLAAARTSPLGVRDVVQDSRVAVIVAAASRRVRSLGKVATASATPACGIRPGA
jgi:hypothetical protein